MGDGSLGKVKDSPHQPSNLISILTLKKKKQTPQKCLLTTTVLHGMYDPLKINALIINKLK